MSVYRLIEYQDEEVKLTLMQDGHDGASMQVPVPEFLEGWRLHKGKVTSLLSGWDPEVNQGSPAQSAAWAVDAVRGAVTLALRAKHAEHEACVGGLELLQHPSAVKVRRPFAAGELVLVAASQRVERVRETGVPAAAFPVGTFDVLGAQCLFVVGSQFVAPVSPAGEQSKSPWVAPFWLCEASTGPQCNMEVRFVPHEVAQYKIMVPTLVNRIAVAAGDRLVWDKDTKMLPSEGALTAAAAAKAKAAEAAAEAKATAKATSAAKSAAPAEAKAKAAAAKKSAAAQAAGEKAAKKPKRASE